MKKTIRNIAIKKNVALVAHDNCKCELLDWVDLNYTKLASHSLYATGTTGKIINERTDLDIKCLISGPMGGDQQLGSLISQGKIDVLIFFWDPLNAVSHDPDVKALLRIASVWNVPTATNSATANFIFSSDLMNKEVDIYIPDYNEYMSSRRV